MDKGTQTMIDNFARNTGKTLPEWIELVKKEGLEKHGEIMSFLKGKHALTHGFANMVALKVKGSDAGSAASEDELITKQYAGKEQMKPIYEKLLAAVQQFGADVEVSPKNAYVNLRRKKQFAMLQPASKTRFEIGINLKGQTAEDKLEVVTAANAMCSHKISLASVEEVDEEIIGWLKKAYEKA